MTDKANLTIRKEEEEEEEPRVFSLFNSETRCILESLRQAYLSGHREKW
jgi:hypothetical protein